MMKPISKKRTMSLRFSRKVSHRSLSLLLLRKLCCLRAANVLTTAYEFETERRCFS